MAALIPLVSGVLFAFGLALAGMTRPEKVVGFLDVTGGWDPSLALVMVGAIGVHFFAWRLAARRALPPAGRPDARLVAGAALFGIGWGLAGYCPGPALVSLGTGAAPALIFGIAMLLGMGLHHLVARAPRGAATREVSACGEEAG